MIIGRIKMLDFATTSKIFFLILDSEFYIGNNTEYIVRYCDREIEVIEVMWTVTKTF